MSRTILKTTPEEREMFRAQSKEPLGIPNQGFTLRLLGDVDALEAEIATEKSLHDLWLEREIGKRFPDGESLPAGQLRVRVFKLCSELLERLGTETENPEG